MDRVDEIIKHWSLERPDVDVEPLAVTARLLLLVPLLIDGCDTALAQVGLTVWQYDVLAALRRAGQPFRLSPTQLAQRVTLSTAAMTNRLDRLEAKGWIRREADPSDRRCLQIQLTPAGGELIDRALPLRIEADRKFLEALPKRSRRELADLLRKLLHAQGSVATGKPAHAIARSTGSL